MPAACSSEAPARPGSIASIAARAASKERQALGTSARVVGSSSAQPEARAAPSATAMPTRRRKALLDGDALYRRLSRLWESELEHAVAELGRDVVAVDLGAEREAAVLLAVVALAVHQRVA